MICTVYFVDLVLGLARNLIAPTSRASGPHSRQVYSSNQIWRNHSEAIPSVLRIRSGSGPDPVGSEPFWSDPDFFKYNQQILNKKHNVV